MAIKNIDLIAAACAEHNIFEVVKTFPQWKAAGYHIKAGSKALFKAQIWKPCKQKITDENGNTTETQKMRLVDAYFFGLSQVEKMH